MRIVCNLIGSYSLSDWQRWIIGVILLNKFDSQTPDSDECGTDRISGQERFEETAGSIHFGHDQIAPISLDDVGHKRGRF